MEMIVHLDSDIFDVVQSGKKCVECRINDEKRRNLHIGDKLIFLRRPDDNDCIEAMVDELIYFSNFDELVLHFEMEQIYLKECSKEEFLHLLERFYKKRGAREIWCCCD